MYEVQEPTLYTAGMVKNRVEHERQRVLGDIGAVLNSRIAKMEILDSKNPSPFRKGAIMAYRDIEDWVRKESLRSEREAVTRR